MPTVVGVVVVVVVGVGVVVVGVVVVVVVVAHSPFLILKNVHGGAEIMRLPLKAGSST